MEEKKNKLYVVIDIGSNTVRMAVYSIEDGELTQRISNKVSCGLAGYVEDGAMSDDGVEVMVETLKQFRIAIEGMRDCTVYAIATASLRMLANREAVLRRVREETGIAIDVISGEEEARYDYYGVMKEMKDPVGVLSDGGGGSTEIAVYTRDEILFGGTIPIGSLGVYRDFVAGIFPTREELETIRRETRAQLATLAIPETGQKTMCAIGGTVRATLKLANKLLAREKTCRSLHIGEYAELFRLYEEEQTMFVRTLLKVKPERVHTLVPGMAIQAEVMDALGCEALAVSEAGVREGYLMHKLEEGDA